ncbi:MAG: D-cysteine desulfhydrase [Reyranellaceae bacterium]
MLQLGRFPRVRLAHLPTPLEPLTRLSERLGGPRLWIKRDDCTGLATGGNKTRKLEYLVADALAQGADTLITVGALQSNHARQTAAAATRLGLKCVLVLEERQTQPTEVYRHNGNLLLDRLLGATLKRVPRDTPLVDAAERAAEEVRRAGGRPYVMPAGGSTPVGALGYVGCALELLQQANDQGLRIDHVVHATGSSGTQAGLLAGFEGARSGVKVLGVTVGRPKASQEHNVAQLLDRTWAHLGLAGEAPHDAVAADDSYVGEAYGVPTPGMIEAVRLLAETEGVLLDPVYSGKAMAGLIDLVRRGRFGRDETVVFIHTGGQAGLFAYEPVFAA